MDPVVNPSPELTLRDYLEIIRRRKWAVIGSFVVVLAIGVGMTLLTTPTYRTRARLLVREAPPKPAARDLQNPLADLLALGQPESVDTQLELLQSESFIEEALEKAGCRASGVGRRGESDTRHPIPDTRSPRPWIKASRVKETNVIDLAVESPDPEAAARVANTMLDQYLRRTEEISLGEVKGARSFVEKARKLAQEALARSERDLLQFRQSHGLAQLTAEQESRTKELVLLETRHRENANAIMRVAAQVREVNAQLAREPAVKRVATGHPNPRRDALAGRLAELETQRAALLAEYREHTPMVARISAQIERVNRDLAAEPTERVIVLTTPNPAHTELLTRLRELTRELRAQEAERAQLGAQLANQTARVHRLGSWEVQLAQLTRARAAAEKSFLTLNEKLQDLMVRENARPSAARIIERALIPTAPARPRKTVNLVIAAMIGIVLGLCVAFLQECLDDRLTRTEELGRLLGLPVLGQVPLLPANQSPLMSVLPPWSPSADSYWRVRSSISMAALDHPLRTFLVTSVEPNEGKTLTAINLAMTTAMEGQNVILVDADLRRPSLHQMLSLPSEPGLSDVLLDRLPAEEALRPTDVPGLRVLTGGSLPSHPAEMVNSARMEELIAWLSEQADVVIFDCPPSGPVPDAQLLAAKVDGVLLVADVRQARRAGLKYAADQLGQARGRLIGLILNKVNAHMRRSYQYYYYRSPRGEKSSGSAGVPPACHASGTPALPGLGRERLNGTKTPALVGQCGNSAEPGNE